MLISFEAFDQLFTRRQLPPEDVATLLLEMAGHVLAPPGQGRPG